MGKRKPVDLGGISLKQQRKLKKPSEIAKIERILMDFKIGTKFAVLYCKVISGGFYDERN